MSSAGKIPADIGAAGNNRSYKKPQPPARGKETNSAEPTTRSDPTGGCDPRTNRISQTCCWEQTWLVHVKERR